MYIRIGKYEHRNLPSVSSASTLPGGIISGDVFGTCSSS